MPAPRTETLRTHGLDPLTRRANGTYYHGPTDHGRGRRCRICNAYLCRYNDADTCWCHNQHPIDLDKLLEALDALAA